MAPLVVLELFSFPYDQSEKKNINTTSSHILINAPKQYIFNFLNEIHCKDF